MFQSFLIALTLLTRLPVGRFVASEWSEQDYQRSVYFYPLVGGVIAVILMVIHYLLPSGAPLLTAALLLLGWITITGALHLDGLADSADTYYAAHKDRNRAMKVFKDPASGPMGVTAIAIVLLLKFSALASLGDSIPLALLCALVLARAAVLLIINTTAYAREEEPKGGMASGLSDASTSRKTWLIVVLSVILCGLLFPVAVSVVVIVMTAGLVWWWRSLWLKLINGFTGDCLGALIELVECLVLLIIALSVLSV